MSFDSYFEHYADQLTDFWERRQNAPEFKRFIRIFGRPFQLASNEQVVLKAADYSLPLYTSAPDIEEKAFNIEIVVRHFDPDPGPLPDNLFDHIQYSGHDDWLALQLGGWGQCQIDLSRGQARAILSTELGCRPDAVSRFLLNTIINNFISSLGLGMLHTTAVYRDNQILMMLAGHNSGKSTTALHLTLAGYAFVSDSQIYIEGDATGIKLYGFPVGRAKLRPDMLAHFPLLEAFLEKEPVRRETKFRLDLHRVDPKLVYDDVIRPEKIHLCLLTRNGRPKTILSPASRSEVMEAAMLNSLYYDGKAGWRKNFEQINALIEQADCHHLSIGTEKDDIIRVVNGLMG
jgi:hypothetical protein